MSKIRLCFSKYLVRSGNQPDIGSLHSKYRQSIILSRLNPGFTLTPLFCMRYSQAIEIRAKNY